MARGSSIGSVVSSMRNGIWWTITGIIGLSTKPSKVVYRAKDGTEEKVFEARVSSTGQALEWLAAMCSHIPDRGEPMVLY